MKTSNPLFTILPLAWIFLIYEYVIRVSDSVILVPLSAHLNLHIDELSWLSSAYYVAYVAFMIPAGILIDRHGLYRMWIIAVSIFTVGCALFAWAPNLYSLIFARILMGIGSNFASIGTLALVIGSKHRSVLIGITLALASLGAFLGQGPWLMLTQYLNSWQSAYWFASLFSLLFLMTWSLLGHRSQAVQLNIHFTHITSSLKQLISSPIFIIIGLYVGCLSSPQTAFSALWAPSFLHRVYNVSSTEAAFLTSLISIGAIFGGVLLGLLGDYVINKHQQMMPTVLALCGLLAACSMLLIIHGDIPQSALIIALFFVGFITNASVLVFAYIGSLFSHLPKASTQASTNMCNMGGGPILQIMIGTLLAQWSHQQNIEQATPSQWQTALYVMPLLILLSSLALLCLYPIQKRLINKVSVLR